MAMEILTKEDLNSFKIELFKELGSLLNRKSENHKEWLRSADVRKLLSISNGTLQTLRINGTLPFTKMGGTIFYAYEDVTKVLNQNKRSTTK
jgi:hypothetical protein